MTAGVPPMAEALRPGASVLGVSATGPVTLLAVQWHGATAVTLTYKDPAGGLGEALITQDRLARLRAAQDGSRWAFTADGEDFRLAAEALRIRLAGLFDPMAAVTTSDLQPLPHQIRAVYHDLLPRVPLRFLLADDPGAGKTVMAGLCIKELLLRADLERCLVVVPGGLVEQWQDELFTKFGLRFEILTRSAADVTIPGENVFTHRPLLLARMDQLARSDFFREQLSESDWDLVVVDEAHRMSARYTDAYTVDKTARYQLGELLAARARHLLLMTATPHAGKDEEFQLFLGLLDPDRFAGRFDQEKHSTDVSDLMRRTIKEDLLTFEGKPLFPQRIAETLPYTLSAGEKELYEAVTNYVRHEMNRSERLDKRKGSTVGFALTVLQRRLASSPQAIHRSLSRRRRRLREHHDLLRDDPRAASRQGGSLTDEELAELADDEFVAASGERLEDRVSDGATASLTLDELRKEIAVLEELESLSAQVLASGEDRKWVELRELLQDPEVLAGPRGERHKLIVFTEHKDTLEYLKDRLTDLLGRPDAVVIIHGGVSRDQRQAVRERFTHDPGCHVLLASDAAGEGLNLQAAHLMINYDLPWNPNRIEQRFGRIHRIGQHEVCRLWNLVAEDTREGQVFTRLLDKIEKQRKQYGGKVFDVLGSCFAERSLRDVLIEAIRFGDRPERKAELDRIIDDEVGEGLVELLEEHALHEVGLDDREVQQLRREMERARALRLQPHYVELFFAEAFGLLGGSWSRRESGRWEITQVPADLRRRPLSVAGRPVSPRYERVTFEPRHLSGLSSPRADLLAPGHPLFDAVLDAVLERHRQTLGTGAVLVDPRDEGRQVRLLVAVTEEITDGTGRVVAKRFDFVTLTERGEAFAGGAAPYLDADPLTAHVAEEQCPDTIAELAGQPWLAAGVENLATQWAVAHGLPEFERSVADRLLPRIAKVRSAAMARLNQQISHWDAEALKLADWQAAGRPVRRTAEWARNTAQDLERRLSRRLEQLEAEAHLVPRPPLVTGAALVVPRGWLVARGLAEERTPPVEHALDTEHVERRAVEAVLAAERTLGREPTRMPHSNPGYDLLSVAPDGRTLFLEVKGRLLGSEDFTVTYNEVLLAKNTAPDHRLALVAVHPDGPHLDEVRYVEGMFDDLRWGSFAATAVTGNWRATWAAGTPPH